MEAIAEEIVFEKYPAYKDSGVEWLGKVPAHWDVKPGYTIVEERKEKNNGLKEKTVLSLSYGSVIIKNEDKLTGLVPESFETYQLVYPGDIIIRPTDLQNDKTSLRTGLAKDKGIITSAYINLKVKHNYSASFYHYFLHSIDTMKVLYGLGSGLRQNLDFGDFKRLPFVVPMPEEQVIIADFLNIKTAQIDQAVAQKERQIELLKERRRVLIHKAVTRGLNPDVQLKDSGVEWIGDIPEHWAIEPIKYSLHGIIDCEHKTAPFVDEEEFFVVRTSNVKEGKLTFNDAKYTNGKGFLQWTKRGIPQPGDILLTREAPAGEACIVPGKINLCLGQRMVWLKVNNERLLSQLAIYLIYSKIGRTYIDFLSAGSTVLHFNMADIKNIPIISMPIKEQSEIVEYLTVLSDKVEKAIELEEFQIEKLKEYKATLINSAVTGKIKVT